jgi:hypothetical protein
MRFPYPHNTYKTIEATIYLNIWETLGFFPRPPGIAALVGDERQQEKYKLWLMGRFVHGGS